MATPIEKFLRFGCLPLLILPIALYLLHGAYIVGVSYLNELRWKQKGIEDYTITASFVALPTLYGHVRVRKGESVGVRNEWGDSKHLTPLEKYQGLTVDGLFDTVRHYAFLPMSWENVAYDSEFGYPKDARFNIFALDAPTALIVDDFKPKQ